MMFLSSAQTGTDIKVMLICSVSLGHWVHTAAVWTSFVLCASLILFCAINLQTPGCCNRTSCFMIRRFSSSQLLQFLCSLYFPFCGSQPFVVSMRATDTLLFCAYDSFSFALKNPPCLSGSLKEIALC